MAKLMNQELHLATFDDHHLLDALPFHIHSIAQDHEQIALKTFQLMRENYNAKQLATPKLIVKLFGDTKTNIVNFKRISYGTFL
ncbi:sucrose operon repressor [Actinobacillus equuli]|nr:sucrose operon repressor [Actinobacillus equuli]